MALWRGVTITCALTVIGLSSIGNAFPLHLHRPPLTHHERERSTRTSVSYKTVDPIENEQISPLPSKSLDGDGGSTVNNGINTGDDNGESDAVEDNAWLSATRTLGSLFLRQEDADRDRNVDVFGRPLVGHETEANDASSPLFSLHEKSLAKYLMDLKFQEELNRERASEQHSTKLNDVWRDKSSTYKVESGVEIDQVRR
jgi:hypothetical protein